MEASSLTKPINDGQLVDQHVIEKACCILYTEPILRSSDKRRKAEQSYTSLPCLASYVYVQATEVNWDYSF